MKPLSFDYAIRVAKLWKAAGGKPEVELGALEPLLWREKNLRAPDLVKALVDLGFTVHMTTNGQLLEKYAKPLKEAGVSKLRISWHCTDPDFFKELSGGHGDYEAFHRGITAAAEAGLQLSFNRVLFEGASRDLQEQLDFIEQYDLRLKLYDLLWTPEIADVYDNIYVDWKKVVKDQIAPRTKSIDKISKEIGRERIRYYLEKGGFVEIKRGDVADRSKYPCYSCNYQSKCLEDFGDYLRVDPELNLYSCYMRRDIGFNLKHILEKGDVSLFRGHLKAMIGPNDLDAFLREGSLRYTVVPHCNFNCRVPGTNSTWCMEEPGGFRYPKMKKSRFEISVSDIKKD